MTVYRTVQDVICVVSQTQTRQNIMTNLLFDPKWTKFVNVYVFVICKFSGKFLLTTNTIKHFPYYFLRDFYKTLLYRYVQNIAQNIVIIFFYV